MKTSTIGLIVCKVFDHKWGQDQYILEDSCEQARVCSRCGAIEKQNRILHQYGNSQYIAPNSCTQEKICSRCKAIEHLKPIFHQFDDWQYISNDSCEQKKVCSRCGTTEKRMHGGHQFGTWQYVSEGSCEIGIVCSRCGAIKDRKLSHDWEKDRSSYSSVYCPADRCKRCGQQGLQRSHKWGAWERESQIGFNRSCKNCGQTDYKDASDYGESLL